VALHGALLMFICKEEVVMDGFSGEMYLCDFGAGMDACQEGPGCIGPGGTNMTAPRLYDWEQWSTRVFVRDALKALFPDRTDIDIIADPGEYGVESAFCRQLCCLIFVVGIMSELDWVIKMVKLLSFVPTRNDAWIVAKPDAARTLKVHNWLDEVQVQASGMSLCWKIWNFIFVCLPKIILWWLTASYGTSFLMETSSIDGIIVNSVALGFLLTFDELITDNLMSAQANYLLDNVVPYHLDTDEELDTDEAAIAKYCSFSMFQVAQDVLTMKLPKLILSGVLTYYLMQTYYHTHCDFKEGRWVSKPVYRPKSMEFTVLNGLFGDLWPPPREATPYWSFPGP
jgi:hypothetical protein